MENGKMSEIKKMIRKNKIQSLFHFLFMGIFL